MTAEVAIVNPFAVALAADSAVTINTSNGETKIFNSVEKLFRISQTQPLAFMVYGNGSFGDISWELIAKEFRSENTETTFLTVNECINSFLEFLKNRTDIVTTAARKSLTISTIDLFIKSVQDLVSVEIAEEISDNERVRQEVTHQFSNNRGLLSSFPFRIGLTEEIYEVVKSQITDDVTNLIQKYFPTIQDEQLNELIIETSSLYLTRCHSAGNNSGLVFAGFGKNEFKPVVESFNFYSALGNHIFIQKNTELSHNPNNNVSVLPFAQDDVIGSFIRGIAPSIYTSIESHSRALLVNILEEFKNKVPEAFENSDNALQTSLLAFIDAQRSEFLKNINTSSNEKLVQPIIGMLQFLPKDELATMAESLVNMTAFRRKVSHDNETVGGPVDVAVLSKNDGFVWIKRKHYFPKEMNDHFFKNRS